ncbi:hypothetical protein [Helicobacter pylori]|uniref:Sortase n=1 Tax=Helicobacter pylori TaxID=210 RepID=A0A1A9H7Y3_HELPX|nr:hypothetical protein [Helicobacter pylori]ANH46809.1 sortase [Helicobacter pylori]
MPLPFILGGLTLFSLNAKACEADEFIKKAESLKEEATKKAESIESDCRRAFARLGEKKLHVLSHTVSNFLNHYHRLNCREFIIKGIDMQDIQGQVSDALKTTNQYREVDFFDTVIRSTRSTTGKALAAYGTDIGVSFAGPVLAPILGALSTSKMEKKLEDTKAYYSQVEVAVKKADVMIDNLQAVRKMAELFTRQITKFDALFFSLSQDAIAIMKKNHYDVSHYSQKEKDQLCVTVSTLMTLSAFLKVSIMDEHQKLQEKAKRALGIMEGQMDALERMKKNRHYDVAMIQSKEEALKDLKG